MLDLASPWIRWGVGEEWNVGDLPHRTLCHLDRILEAGIAGWF